MISESQYAKALTTVSKLTPRQRLALRQMLADEVCPLPRNIMKQLEAKGLAARTLQEHAQGTWGKVTKSLPVGYLTPKGKDVAEVLMFLLKQDA